MNELELWMNPNLSIEERFEIARGEIARLNWVVAKLSERATTPHSEVDGFIQVGSRITIGKRVNDRPDRSYSYDSAVYSLYVSGSPVEVLSIDIDVNGEAAYIVQVGGYEYGIYRDWIKSVE